MTKHKTETFTLSEIINGIDPRSSDGWHEIMGIDIPGHAEAVAAAKAADDDDQLWAHADAIESAYIRQHCNDRYEVSWPDHVLTPRFNSDASYQ